MTKPESSADLDHQPFQLANVHGHEPTMIVNNVIGLAKTARVFGVPTFVLLNALRHLPSTEAAIQQTNEGVRQHLDAVGK